MVLKREFIEPEADGDRIGYLDGFRFGLGFLAAWVLGLAAIGIAIISALALFGR